jgi:hypothetical protein
MSEENFAWLGAALYLKRLGADTETAAELAGPVLEALRGVAAAEKGQQ